MDLHKEFQKSGVIASFRRPGHANLRRDELDAYAGNCRTAEGPAIGNLNGLRGTSSRRLLRRHWCWRSCLQRAWPERPWADRLSPALLYIDSDQVLDGAYRAHDPPGYLLCSSPSWRRQPGRRRSVQHPARAEHGRGNVYVVVMCAAACPAGFAALAPPTPILTRRIPATDGADHHARTRRGALIVTGLAILLWPPNRKG